MAYASHGTRAGADIYSGAARAPISMAAAIHAPSAAATAAGPLATSVGPAPLIDKPS